MESDLLKRIAEQALWDGIGLYGLRLRRVKNGYHIQIELDGLNDPSGAVGLEQCERFSKAFIELLDRAIGGSLPAGLSAEEELPRDLEEENYSLEVSSAGVERVLRLPDEFERFRGRPLKIRFRGEDEKARVEHGIFDGFEQEQVRFLGFVPHAPKKGKVRIPEPFLIRLDRIEKVNLYLDV